MNQTKIDTNPCCPKFDTAPWDEKLHQWQEKLFIKDSIPQVFHIPLPGTINRVMGDMWEQAQQAVAAPNLKDLLKSITSTLLPVPNAPKSMAIIM